jgi:hypothetical protein
MKSNALVDSLCKGIDSTALALCWHRVQNCNELQRKLTTRKEEEEIFFGRLCCESVGQG